VAGSTTGGRGPGRPCSPGLPLESKLQRRIDLHRQASAYRSRAFAILDTPGTLDDGEALTLVNELMDAASDARAAAGGMISVSWGRRRITYGLDL
jgi:hypothetical protein